MTLPDGFTLAESNASSTEVRKRAKYTYGRDLSGGEAGILALVAMDGLVPPAVLAYIVRHRLYKNLAYKEGWQRAGSAARLLVAAAKTGRLAAHDSKGLNERRRDIPGSS